MEPFYMLEYEKRLTECIDDPHFSTLYIHHLPDWIYNKMQLQSIIEKCLMIGKLKCIIMDEKRRCASLSFEYWYDTMDTRVIKQQLKENKYIHIHGFLSNERLFVFTPTEMISISDMRELKWVERKGFVFSYFNIPML